MPELTDLNDTSLEAFEIEGNQWECDCHNKWLIDLMNAKKFTIFGKAAFCTRPTKLKGFSFLETKEFQELPCIGKDKFDPKLKDFGLEHPTSNRNGNENKIVALTVATGCVLAILFSIIFVTGLYVRKQRRISYNYLSSFKIHFSRRRPRQELGSQTSLANSVYRDNPTTLPADQ